MDIKKAEEFLKNYGVYQYHKAAKALMNKGYYMRGRNFRPEDGDPTNCDLYVISEADTIIQLCYNITRHRAFVVLKAHRNNTLKDVEEDVLNNYLNNGYMTRRGLFADYGEKKRNRIRRIADSHRAVFLGGAEGHNIRVRMRNGY